MGSLTTLDRFPVVSPIVNPAKLYLLPSSVTDRQACVCGCRFQRRIRADQFRSRCERHGICCRFQLTANQIQLPQIDSKAHQSEEYRDHQHKYLHGHSTTSETGACADLAPRLIWVPDVHAVQQTQAFSPAALVRLSSFPSYPDGSCPFPLARSAGSSPASQAFGPSLPPSRV